MTGPGKGAREAMAQEETVPVPPKYEDEIAGYRQPMVTSIGIVLAFLLAFLANWAAEATNAPAISTVSDAVVALALLGSVGLFTVALFRVLDNRVHDRAGERYQRTFRIYISAFVFSFVGLGVALIL